MPSIPLTYVLCFLTRGDEVLMLHRRRAPNRGLWNGVGGRIEADETPLAACLREVEEETGYILADARFCGILTWDGFEIPPGGLYIYTAPAPPGYPRPTPEGELAWKPRAWVFSSAGVVSNIHRFGPPVLSGAPPQEYYFEYRDGKITRFVVRPLDD